MHRLRTQQQPVEIFYSYVDDDTPLLEHLEQHLRVLQHEGAITTWHRQKLLAGGNQQKADERHFNAASLILSLISADYLASDDRYGVELPRAPERQRANEVKVIPILMRPCDWTAAPFADLLVLPRNHRPLDCWANLDAGLSEVAREIRAALGELRTLALRRRPTPLPEIWLVPYPRNPVFTGRADLLQTLHTLLPGEQTTTLLQPQTQALSGLGGIGKTQVAIEYAYQAASQYTAVFWVSGETQETLTAGYAGIARSLRPPQQDEQDQQIIIRAVTYWLQTHRDWLLILDNVAHLTLVQPFLPATAGGHVLLTTRSQISGRMVHRLDVPVLSHEEGAFLLLQRAGLLARQCDLEEETIEEASRLSQLLGGLPLALDQAGAYMEEMQCSLQSYLERFRHHQAFFLSWRETLPVDYPAPVATTWSLSFQQVEQQSPLAARMVRFCAFLAAEDIPEELITHALDTGLLAEGHVQVHEDVVEQRVPEQLDALVHVLRAYSLIQRKSRERTLTLHRLVQMVVRLALPEKDRQIWWKRAVCVLSERLPALSFEHWPQCERYVSHAQECVSLGTPGTQGGIEQARALHWVGAYLLERRRAGEAGEYLQQALHLRGRLPANAQEETAGSVDRLAHCWELQGRYQEAEPPYQCALATRERLLGAEHPATASSLNNLAALYYQQGRCQEAEPLYLRALAIRERQLGAGHPATATGLNNLAALYESQGRYQEAEPLYLRALDVREQRLGAEHPATATSLNNLAALYESQGRYQEAEPLHLRTLAIRERLLGAEHPSIATSLNNLAALYRQQGRSQEAEPLYLRALALRERLLGAEHPATATSLNNLASTASRAAPRKLNLSTCALWLSLNMRWEPSTPRPPPASTIWPHSITSRAVLGKPNPSTCAP